MLWKLQTHLDFLKKIKTAQTIASGVGKILLAAATDKAQYANGKITFKNENNLNFANYHKHTYQIETWTWPANLNNQATADIKLESSWFWKELTDTLGQSYYKGSCDRGGKTDPGIRFYVKSGKFLVVEVDWNSCFSVKVSGTYNEVRDSSAYGCTSQCESLYEKTVEEFLIAGATSLPLVKFNYAISIVPKDILDEIPMAFHDADYAGTSIFMGVSSKNVGTDTNDRLSSILVPPNFRITLYEHDNWNGQSYVIQGPRHMLYVGDFNDRMTSFKTEMFLLTDYVVIDSASKDISIPILTNTCLSENQSLSSYDGKYKLFVQNDGNVVVYTNQGVAVFVIRRTCSNCSPKLCVQEDGNLVLYQNTKAVFATNTASTPFSQYSLVIGYQGYPVVYDKSNGKVVWAGSKFEN